MERAILSADAGTDVYNFAGLLNVPSLVDPVSADKT